MSASLDAPNRWDTRAMAMATARNLLFRAGYGPGNVLRYAVLAFPRRCRAMVVDDSPITMMSRPLWAECSRVIPGAV